MLSNEKTSRLFAKSSKNKDALTYIIQIENYASGSVRSDNNQHYSHK